MRFLLNKDSLKELPFKNNILRSTIHPGEWLVKWKDERGYILVYKKKGKKAKTCILYVHGGGFDKNQPRDKDYEAMGYYLANYTEYDTYIPDYSLSTNRQFPIQINEIIYIAKKLSNLYDNIIIGGDSAGGTLAIQVAMVEPKLFYSGFLLSPWIDIDGKYTPSYFSRAWCEKNKSGDPIFKEPPIENIRNSKIEALKYLGKEQLFKNPLANPVLATPDMLDKLPPFLIFIGDDEVIRDGVLKMVGNAQEVNNNIYCYLYTGMWHDWLLYSQSSSKIKGKHALEILFKFCKFKFTNKSKEFLYTPSNYDLITANCNVIL